jgi:hypothetical protein
MLSSFFRRPAVVNGFEESGLAISGVANGFEVPAGHTVGTYLEPGMRQ